MEGTPRTNRNHLQIDITLEDSKAFTKTWKGQRLAELVQNGGMRENVTCAERIMRGDTLARR